MARVAIGFGPSHVLAAGVLAGLVFAMFEMIAAAMLMGVGAFFAPLRMIGAIVLGAGALDPAYSLVAAGLTGVIVHMILSIAFAMVFAMIVSPESRPESLATIGIAFGIVLWIVNFYVIAPLAGWTWFPEQSNAVVQFLAHAFFFGLPLGWYLARTRGVVADHLA